MPIARRLVASLTARPRRLSLALFGAGLLLRALGLAVFPHPAYPDAFYYASVARELSQGHGFTIPYVWAFVEVGGQVPLLGQLPIPSNAHWMPLASLLAAPFMWLLGPTDVAAALPFVLTGAALAPFTYLLGRDLFGNETVARFAALCALIPAGATPFLAQPDNYALYALLVGGVLWGLGRVLRDGHRTRLTMAIVGLLAGLAVLARNDGVLLFATIGLAYLVERVVARRAQRPSHLDLGALLLALAIGLAVTAPWLIRQMLVFGSLSPSSASGRILFIRSYGEMFSADGPLRLDYLLSWGLGPLLLSRLAGLATAVGLWSMLIGAFLFAPLAVIGAWQQRRNAALAPLLLWTGLFWAWSGLVAAPHLATGNFLHSAVALVPATYLLGFMGYRVVIERVARRLPTWDAHAGARRWRLVLVAAVLAVGGPTIFSIAHSWSLTRADYQAAGAYLAAHGPAEARVMSANPGAAWWDAGHAGVQTPDSSAAIIEQAIRRYDIRWVLLEGDSIVPAFAPILRGSAHLPFLSAAPVFRIANTVDPARPDRLAIFAVCPVDTPNC